MSNLSNFRSICDSRDDSSTKDTTMNDEARRALSTIAKWWAAFITIVRAKWPVFVSFARAKFRDAPPPIQLAVGTVATIAAGVMLWFVAAAVFGGRVGDLNTLADGARLEVESTAQSGGRSDNVVRSPFKCTADDFEAAAIGWRMPFKPNRRSDAEAMCRVSKFASTAHTIGRHMWLCRRNGDVRAVMFKWGRASDHAGIRDAEQEDVDSFRRIADQLFSETSAAELMRWFIVSGPLLDQFQATTDLVAQTHPTVPTDMVCQKDGVRVAYRRIVANETLVIHVVNFEIDRKNPEWPTDGPYGDD